MKQRWVLASGNAGKISEFKSLFSSLPIDIVGQKTLGISDADETGLSFVENAIIKARHAAYESGLPAIADDSGLAVDALNGAPGIYSARYSRDEVGDAADDNSNNQKLLRVLQPFTAAQRGAQFICALAFLRHAEDPIPILSLGVWRGVILSEPSGDNGFGYDPLFYVPEFKCTSAQLDRTTKNLSSHRAMAMQELLIALKARGVIAEE